MIFETLIAVLLIVGAGFMFLGGVALVRMPDLYSRMSATAKASSLGLGLVLLGMALHFSDWGVTLRTLVVIFFGFLTAPVAAHMIARAAYFMNIPLWEGTIIDELRGKYDILTHELRSAPVPPTTDQLDRSSP
jgi:multicomponent Na+:H+ antiporter subunit G